MFLDHTQRRTTVSRTLLGEWSACRRDLYLTTHDTHNRQISMPPVGFKPKISAGERPRLLMSCIWHHDIKYLNCFVWHISRFHALYKPNMKYKCILLATQEMYSTVSSPDLVLGMCKPSILTLRLLMSYIYIYIYGAHILDVSRSHTTTHHSQ